jgi:hypothetical protein
MGCSCSVHGSDKIKEEGRHMYIYERRRVGEKLDINLRHPEPGLHVLGRGGHVNSRHTITSCRTLFNKALGK